MNTEAPKRINWTLVVVAIVMSLVGGGVASTLVVSGAGGNVAITKGGVKIEISADEDFGDLLDKALKQDRSEIEAILGSRRYYHFSSDEFLIELSEIEPEDAGWEKISDRMRRMLANLEGPFQLPGTFVEADEKLMQAFDDLDKAMSSSESEEASALLATLWERILDQRGVFRQRAFPAEIVLLEHAPDDMRIIFTCSGGALVGGRIVDVFTTNGTSLKGEIRNDPSIFDCPESPNVTVRKMLTGKVPIELAVNRAAYSQLFPNSAAMPKSGQSGDAAKFVVYPRNLTSATYMEK